MKVDKCPISKIDNKSKYLDLGDIPLVNNLCESREDSLNCNRYPLAVQLFSDSNLTSLTEVVPKEHLFYHYLYRSGISKPYIDHCAKMYDYIDSYVSIFSNDCIMDIGGNDGSLLNAFKGKNNQHCTYINIDPSFEFIEDNEKNGIVQIPIFFNQDFRLESKAKIITSTNVFQHNLDINSFVIGVTNNLHDEGVWCLEFPYWMTTMITDNYDQIYHEHVYYYLLRNIIDICKNNGLKVVNVSYHDIHAGTLRVMIVKNDNVLEPDSTIDSFLSLEKIVSLDYCNKWGVDISAKIKEMEAFFKELGNVNVFGFGAAAKGCVFLNSCHLDYTSIAYVIDDTKEKQGKFIPGTGIEIVSRDILKQVQPDYILILAHNFKEYIIESLRKDYDGKFIVMFPTIQIL